METFIFVLGRDPELSIEELLTYLESRNIEFEHVEDSDIAVVLNLPSVNAKNMIKELGGIQKIAKSITKIDNLYYGKDNKVKYAISNYSEDDETEIKSQMKAYFKGEKLKATLKKSHHPQDFLTPSEAKDVLEIILYNGFVARTLAVSNPQDLEFRDINRPVTKSTHKISIRLAKILINLSGAKPGKTILVPFSGLGTIAQEASILGIDVIATDDQEFFVEASKKNLGWIKKQYSTTSKVKVLKADVKNLSRQVKKVDFVVTEPYMGPALKFTPSEGEAKRTLKKLLPLYEKLITELGKVTKDTAVVVAPKLKSKSKKEFNLLLEPLFRLAGFKFDEPLIYAPSKARIIREIWVLKKN
jgi:tRNA G10  N-methylase Trm11